MTLTTANLPVNIGVNGTITASQFSPITLTGNLSGSVLDVSFVVSGTHGTTGTATITIPKSAVPPGDLPRVYLNGTVAAVQSYTQDVNSDLRDLLDAVQSSLSANRVLSGERGNLDRVFFFHFPVERFVTPDFLSGRGWSCSRRASDGNNRSQSEKTT